MQGVERVWWLPMLQTFGKKNVWVFFIAFFPLRVVVVHPGVNNYVPRTAAQISEKQPVATKLGTLPVSVLLAQGIALIPALMSGIGGNFFADQLRYFGK